jgi:hypothetical protein
MSTLKLDTIQHPDAAGAALTFDSDGTVTHNGGTLLTSASDIPSDNLTGSVTVDGSGNVGIGTDSPTKPLHIYGNTSNNHQLLLDNAFGSGSSWSLNAYGANGNLYIGNNLDRFVIDSAGRVTMPYQVSFRVNLGSNFETDGTAEKVTGFGTGSHASYNSLGYWSTSNNRFTAPVTGKYLFNATTLFNLPSGGWRRLYFYVNGSYAAEFLFGGHNYSDGWDGVSASAILHLDVNDYFELYADSSNTGYMYNGYTQLDGYLIG